MSPSHTWQRDRKAELSKGISCKCSPSVVSLSEPQANLEDGMREKTPLKSLKGDKILSEYKRGISAGLTKKKQFSVAFLLYRSDMELLCCWHYDTHQPQENGIPTALTRDSK